MLEKFFSILVVCLNPGDKLEKTIQSILQQSYTDYEIIIKDGGSTDGSIETLQSKKYLEDYPQIRLVREKDSSIYDAMNQAVKEACGSYLLFLNCGDYFYDSTVLEKVAASIVPKSSLQIYYGDQYNQLQRAVVSSAPGIDDFTCFRNVPCHQVCFYEHRLFENRGYDTKYVVRADYEHFLYCVYEEKAECTHLPIIISAYEGGGFSETKENRIQSALEHREITDRYLGEKAKKYRLIMAVTLAPLRTFLAEDPRFSKWYNGIKSFVYKREEQ